MEHLPVNPRLKRMVVGVTGCAGSGKSTVCSMLGQLGARVLSADALVAEAYGKPEVLAALVARFGPRSVRADATVDRLYLSKLVFRNPQARKDLESMVHPYVLSRIREAVAWYRTEDNAPPMLAVEIPLLFEAGAEGMVDRVLVAAAPPGICAQRLRARGWDEERIRAVQDSQIAIEEKMKRADCVVDTSGDEAVTAREAEAAWRAWKR